MIVTWRGKQGTTSFDKAVVFTRRAVPISKTVTPGPRSLGLTGYAPGLGLRIIPPTRALQTSGYAPQLQLVVTVPARNLVLAGSVAQLRLAVIPVTLALLILTFVPEAVTPAIYPNASWTPVIYLRARP